MTIVQKLSLNKHPKDNINLSLVNAHNVKVSHDESCIMNEESIRENTFIKSYLNTYYGTGVQYKIVGIIPCNNELVLIVKPSNVTDLADIFRYREGNETVAESMYCAYGGKTSLNRFSYLGGKIRGTFTYNVESSLIVAITEYNAANYKIPLRTINLGNFDNTSIYNDIDVPNGLLSVAPEVTLPEVSNLRYVAGTSYKGWYYMFIRYKINSIDYTQWYSIGFPIYVDTLERYQIVRYCYNRNPKLNPVPLNLIIAPNMPDDGFGVGCSDYLSNTSDIANESFKVDISVNNTNKYDKYQIGIICTSKSYTKAFKTSDIDFNENYTVNGSNNIYNYTFDNNSLSEYSAEELIADNYNYFNAEHVINYQNRLYISKYEEPNLNDKNIDINQINNIISRLYLNEVEDYSDATDVAIINKDSNREPNQYDSNIGNIEIPMHEYLGVSDQTVITVDDGAGVVKTDKAGKFRLSAGDDFTGFMFIVHMEPITNWTFTPTYFGKDSEKDVSIKLSGIEASNTSVIMFNTRENAINNSRPYINTNTSFNNRKKESCLIPGEVYNFFIHFVDKYGHSTNGYRINNNIKWSTVDNRSSDIIPVPFRILIGSTYNTYYAALSFNNNVSKLATANSYDIDVSGVTFYTGYNDSNGQDPYLTGRVLNSDTILLANCLKSFKDYYSSYATAKFINYKWYQVSYGPGERAFHSYINNNGDRLFKVPIVETYDGIERNDIYEPLLQRHILPRVKFDNIQIPYGYDGYFISYEKFESLQRVSGVLTRNDFRSQDYINKINLAEELMTSTILQTANDSKSDKMYFYSGQYDISDSIKLDYNIIRVDGINVFKNDDIPTYDNYQRNSGFNFMHDLNKPQILSYGKDPVKTYAIPEYKIAVADSAVDNRMGVGTALQIKDAYNLFPNYVPKHGLYSTGNNSRIKIYRVTLLNTTRDIYMSDNKTLIKLTDIKYKSNNHTPITKYSTGDINNGYNGRYTFDGVIIYENEGLSFNTTTNKVTRLEQDTEYYKSEVPDATPHTYQNDIPFLAYCQFPVCTDIIYESKSFKAPPEGVVYLVKSDNDQNKYYTGSMVTPANSIDLFENRQSSSDNFNPKTYTNYREDLVSVDIYGKTIRRSNVIQDETRANGWRRFPIEGYKSISENKGNITNLVGIGVVLLVHTEHSLFIFDTDNTLRTEGRDIQLSQPDAFEVRYKEVFTSDLGFGGLQDSKSYIIDQFGYIFYSRDTNRIYHFDNNQLGNMDDDIIEWLHKYKPFNVRFANDKYNNRILIKMDYIINSVSKSVVLSYNYNTKTFITQHTYYFDEAYSTKTGLYLHCDNEHTGCTLHQFVDKETSYGSYDNIKGSIGVPTIQKSKLSFIVNERFNSVKFLEYITYKLTKYINDTNIDFTNSPVEEYMEPFSGNTITVYNNMVNTGVLDIKVDNESDKNIFAEFDKPYWDLGVWNFSYLRNNIDKLNNGVSAGDMSRVFGNYFIIEFEFNNEDGRRIEFEELGYELSKD